MYRNYKYSLCLLSLSFSFLFSYSQNIWTQKADFINVRSRAFSFNIGSKGYVGTGLPLSYDDFWEYNPSTDTWAQKANFGGQGTYGAIGICIGTKGYVATGWIGSGYDNLWEYDPSLNIWNQKANFPPNNRDGAIAFALGNKGYFCSGTTNNDTWEYDPNLNTWTQKSNLPVVARDWAVGFGVGNRGFLCTGNDANISSCQIDIYEFDAILNTWTQKANFPGTPRNGAIAFSIGSKGYVGTGGDVNLIPLNDFWEYDSNNDTWTQIPCPIQTRINAFAFSIGSKGYVGAGKSDTLTGWLKDFWEFSPDSISGITENSQDKFNIYPNPALNYIAILNKKSAVFSFEIYNSSGELMLMQDGNSPETILDIKKFSAGIYFIQIISNRENINLKFLKQ